MDDSIAELCVWLAHVSLDLPGLVLSGISVHFISQSRLRTTAHYSPVLPGL